MNHTNKLSGVIVLLLMILISASTLWAQEEQVQTDDQSFQGFNLEGFDESGKKSWDVNGETADIQGADVNLTNVDANAYGDQKLNVRAQSGTLNQVSGNMHLEEDVIITGEDGMQLTTDSLDWSRDDDLVSTDDEVMITDEGYTVTGKGMVAKPGLKDAEIKENVTVTVDTEPDNPDDRFVTITSDGPMMVNQSTFMATFEVNVVAIQSDRTLKADRMEIYFNESMDEIQKMICIGSVEILQGENKTFAQRAVYDAVAESLVLSGRPKLIMLTEGDNALTAVGN